MTLRMNCPSCGQQLSLDDTQPGQAVRCPSCDSFVSPTDANRSQGIASQPRSAPGFEAPQRTTRYRRSVSTARRSGVASVVLGIFALVVGVAALCISWVPVVCVISLVAAGFGLLLGLAGFVTALIQKRLLGIGLSLAGGGVNLLALFVALIVTILTGSFVGVMRLDALGEASAGATVPEWGQVFDPDGDCTIETKGTSLNIRVPATAHDLSAELGLVNAPRVLQEVEGDFVVEVKVCGTIQPGINPTIPGRASCQSAGLLVWEDPRNFIRLERAALNRDGQMLSYASLERRAHGWPWAVPQIGLMDRDIYLRLERRGDQIVGSISEDGNQWKRLQPLQAPLPNKVRIGVAAVNAAGQPLNVHFEEFKIQKK